jgi:hypothetical protein
VQFLNSSIPHPVPLLSNSLPYCFFRHCPKSGAELQKHTTYDVQLKGINKVQPCTQLLTNSLEMFNPYETMSSGDSGQTLEEKITCCRDFLMNFEGTIVIHDSF